MNPKSEAKYTVGGWEGAKGECGLGNWILDACPEPVEGLDIGYWIFDVG